MQKKIFRAFTAVSLVLVFSFIQSDNPVTRINRALNIFFEKYPQEKVYLQFDKLWYAIGDTLWYKGYVTYNNAPSPVSKILYVEVFDNTGRIIKRQTVPVEDGDAYGDIVLNGDFPSEKYHVRAYTSWMMNFDPSFYFYNDIDVGLDEPAQDRTTSVGDSSNYFVEFFPEGGDLIAGLTSLVAFKAFDQNGLPVNIKGKIQDSSGKTIEEVQTMHNGMGSFIIHPLSGKHYSVVVEDNNGTKKLFPLPDIKSSGIVFHAQTVSSFKGDSVYFRTSRSIIARESYQHLIICSEMQGISDFNYINFDEETAGNYNNRIIDAPTPLPVEQFPSGILHLSVFNESGEVLAQRLVFLHHDRQEEDAELQGTALNFAPHSKNVFTLRVPADLKGNYSVSVTDADTEKQRTYNGNILSDLLLTRDVKTYINDPDWYFEENSQQKAKALDLVMLTSRWSRFSWEKILADKFPSLKYYPEQSLLIKGRAFAVKDKTAKPLVNGEVPIMIREQNGSLKHILSVPVDSMGYFTLTNLDFYDTATIYVKNEAEKKSKIQDIRVQFDHNAVDSIRYAMLPDYTGNFSGKRINIARSSGVEKNKLEDTVAGNRQDLSHKDKAVLNPVTVRAKIKTHTDSTIAGYATGAFANPNDWSLNYDFTNDRVAAFTNHMNVLQYIIANVPGLQVYYRPYSQDQTSLSVNSSVPYIAWRMTSSLFINTDFYQRVLANVPAFFLNEQQLTGEGAGDYGAAIDLLQSIPLSNVALIRVFPPGTKPMVSGNSPNGIIAIYTINKREVRDGYRGNFFDRAKKVGYSVAHHFSSPDYDGRKNISIPDMRSTLYWNPTLKTDSISHTAVFSFYNNDVTRRFHVVIEGIDKNGKIVREDKIFQ